MMAHRQLVDQHANFQRAWGALVGLSGPKPRMPDQPVDWDLVIDLADNQKSALLLARGLAATATTELPNAPSLRLKELANLRGNEALMLARETAILANRLRDAGISYSVMKGAPLSWMVHGGLAVRDPGDIDLIVPESQIVATSSILNEMQYACDFSQLLKSSRQRDRLLRSTNQLPFWNEKSGIGVELHWRWQKFEGMMPNVPNRIWREPITIPGLGKLVTPDPVEHFIYLCAHGLGHGWSRLKWLNDIRWILHNGSLVENDWDAVVARAEEIGMARPVAIGPLAAASVDEIVLPKPLRELAERLQKSQPRADRSLEWMLEQASAPEPSLGPKPPLAIARGLLRHMELTVSDKLGKRWVRLRALFLPSPPELMLINLPRGLGFGYLLVRAGRMIRRIF